MILNLMAFYIHCLGTHFSHNFLQVLFYYFQPKQNWNSYSNESFSEIAYHICDTMKKTL